SSYRYTDASVTNGTVYHYSLVAISASGDRQVLGNVSVTPSFNAATVTEYALHQNYPNPFNPTTSIALDLVDNGFVSLKVYNLMGQEVASLVNGNLSSGRHIVSFDAASLSSGVYLYRLNVNGFVAEKKMLLMK
ncbi:MAG TPA: T9SS type A sorting domain-containing protein, partial [bacterium]